jgi:hypothetical protein
MNVFQQVFATVNPRAAVILRETENNERNKDKSAPKTALEKPRIKFPDFDDALTVNKPEPRPDRQSKPPQPLPESSGTSLPRKTIPKREKHFGASSQGIEPIRKAKTDKTVETCVDVPEVPNRKSELEKAIDAMIEEKRSVDEMLKAAHSQHFDLCRKNADLEHQINLLRRKATEQHANMKDLALDHNEDTAELTESWEFRINEVQMEIALLRSGEATCDV